MWLTDFVEKSQRKLLATVCNGASCNEDANSAYVCHEMYVSKIILRTIKNNSLFLIRGHTVFWLDARFSFMVDQIFIE